MKVKADIQLGYVEQKKKKDFLNIKLKIKT